MEAGLQRTFLYSCTELLPKFIDDIEDMYSAAFTKGDHSLAHVRVYPTADSRADEPFGQD